MEKDIQVKENKFGATHIRFEVFYRKGGINHWTGKNEDSGYYLSAIPVQIGELSVRELISYGSKVLVKKCGRRSEKAYKTAVEMAKGFYEDVLNNVLDESGLQLM